MKKFIVLILSLFFGLGSVYAYSESISPISIVYGNPTGMQYSYNVITETSAGTLFYRGDLNPTSLNTSISKGAFQYDFTNYNYDYFSILIKINGSTFASSSGVIDSISVQFAENNCQNVGAFNGGSHGYYSFVCQNSKVNDYLNIYPNDPAFKILVGAKISFYDDISTAKLNSIEQLQQQQLQFIQNSDTTGANTGYGSVFNESVADTTGTSALFGVLQNFITNLGSNDTCSSFSIPIPFLNSQNVVLPCMRSVYTQHFGLIYNLVQIILSAIIFYWCVVNVLKLFKETLDPFNYKLEVLDL